MPELSIIMPFVNEYPQNVFTVQNVMCELNGRVDYEIIAINNWVPNSSCGNAQDKGFKFKRQLSQNCIFGNQFPKRGCMAGKVWHLVTYQGRINKNSI